MKLKTVLFRTLLAVALIFSINSGIQAEPSVGASLEKLRSHCLEILKDALASDEAFIRSGAVRAAGESRDSRVLPLLLKGTHDFFPTTRQFALQGLRKVSEEEAVRNSLKLLNDSNVWVQATALEIIAELGNRRMMSKIRPLLEAPDPMVRLGSSYALYSLGDTTQLDVLLKAAEGGDAIGRYQAITYLGKINIPITRSHLVKLLEEGQDDEIKIFSLKALDDHAEIEQLRVLEKLLDHPNPRVRKQAVLVMGHLPAQAALGRVTPLCVDKDPMVQVVSAMAASRLKSPQCDEVFKMAVQHGDYGVRSVAARILGELNRPDSAKLLVYGLNDSNSRVRTAAVRAVGKIGSPKMLSLLLQMLDDSAIVIRAYAAGYLLKMLRPDTKSSPAQNSKN